LSSGELKSYHFSFMDNQIKLLSNHRHNSFSQNRCKSIPKNTPRQPFKPKAQAAKIPFNSKKISRDTTPHPGTTRHFGNFS